MTFLEHAFLNDKSRRNLFKEHILRGLIRNHSKHEIDALHIERFKNEDWFKNLSYAACGVECLQAYLKRNKKTESHVSCKGKRCDWCWNLEYSQENIKKLF